VRSALFRLALRERFPPGLVMPLSMVKRGLMIETHRNQLLNLTSKRFQPIK
jgi:hypothetical protein